MRDQLFCFEWKPSQCSSVSPSANQELHLHGILFRVKTSCPSGLDSQFRNGPHRTLSREETSQRSEKVTPPRRTENPSDALSRCNWAQLGSDRLSGFSLPYLSKYLLADIRITPGVTNSQNPNRHTSTRNATRGFRLSAVGCYLYSVEREVLGIAKSAALLTLYLHWKALLVDTQATRSCRIQVRPNR